MEKMALSQSIFVNRVPVLDGRLRTYAYEIELFDHHQGPETVAAKRVYGGPNLSDTLNVIDPNRLVGDRKAILRIDPAEREAPLSEEWRKKLIFEIPASSLKNPNQEFIDRLADNTRQWCVDGPPSPQSGTIALPLHCFMKLDIARESQAGLAQRVSALGGTRVTPIATSVESRKQFQMCGQAGVNLFMGDFYTEPPEARQKSITPNQALLLELSAKTTQDTDIRAIETIFKQNPDLAFGLMNLVHSAFYRGSEHVASIRQAIALLGYENLHKWVSLMLFTIEKGDLGGNPLFEKALVRARTMELAAMNLRRKGLGSSAYIAGIFSLIPALFDVPVEEILTRANFVDEIKQALIEGSGILGDLLVAVKELEKGGHETFSPSAQLGLQPEDFFHAHTEALMEHTAFPETIEPDSGYAAVQQPYFSLDVSGKRNGVNDAGNHEKNHSWIGRLFARFTRKTTSSPVVQ